MIKGEYKKILWDIFDVLGFFDEEKEKALDGFKKKFANEMLKELQGSFSTEQHQWLTQAIAKKEYDKNDPKISDIQNTINSAYPKDKMDEMSSAVFKKILASYINFMVQKVDPEKVEKLKRIAGSF